MARDEKTGIIYSDYPESVQCFLPSALEFGSRPLEDGVIEALEHGWSYDRASGKWAGPCEMISTITCHLDGCMDETFYGMSLHELFHDINVAGWGHQKNHKDEMVWIAPAHVEQTVIA